MNNNLITCSFCHTVRPPYHYRAKDAGICVFCANDGVKLVKNKKQRRRYNNARERQYYTYVDKSAQRGIKFDIDIDTYYRFKSMLCYYCGELGGGIDRVDSSQGYAIDNCVPCCSVCNFMKRNLALDSFLAQCRKIVKTADEI